FLFGLLEQIYLTAPLELRGVALTIARFLPEDQLTAAGRSLANCRDRFMPLKSVPDLPSLLPGTPEARAGLAIQRYRAFKKTGALDRADELPEELESMEEMSMLIPRFYPPAPPADQWRSFTMNTASKLRLTQEQRKTALQITADLQQRAGEYLEASRSDF